MFQQRFIPTCVGNSIKYPLELFAGSVHPHVCGELSSTLASWPTKNGSSPRVWGTRYVPVVLVDKNRFIPTCVGNSHSKSQVESKQAVHPHVCGELFSPSFSITTSCGSSPRVWGTLSMSIIVDGLVRFIPTCVGNSCYAADSHIKLTVHPHVCGELPCKGSVKSSSLGSSPRVWGTRYNHYQFWQEGRFIPTCVGNSRQKSRVYREVHGSSPRVWGTLGILWN